MASKQELDAAQAAVRYSLENDPLEIEYTSEWKAMFMLARRIQGILIMHGLPRDALPLRAWHWAVEEVVGSLQTVDVDEAIERFHGVYGQVVAPEGVNPVEAAAEKAPGTTVLPCEFPTERMARNAARTFEIAQQLRDARGEFYLSVRSLGAALDCDAMHAGRVLGALVNAGILERVGQASARTAQRFRVTESQSLRVSDDSETS